MPYVSTSQRGWMHVNEPAMAKRWDAHTPKGKKLPRHVKKKALDQVRALVKEARMRRAVDEALKEARPKGANTEFLESLQNGLNMMPLPLAMKVAAYWDPVAHRELVFSVIGRLLKR